MVYVTLRPSGTCKLLIKKIVPVPEMCSLSGLDFPTSLLISLPYALCAGPLRSLPREDFFSGSSWGGVVRPAM